MLPAIYIISEAFYVHLYVRDPVRDTLRRFRRGYMSGLSLLHHTVFDIENSQEDYLIKMIRCEREKQLSLLKSLSYLHLAKVRVRALTPEPSGSYSENYTVRCILPRRCVIDKTGNPSCLSFL